MITDVNIIPVVHTGYVTDYIMAGSALKEVLSTIYAANSVDPIFNGHNYS